MTTTCPACGNARFIFAGTIGASVPCPCVALAAATAARLAAEQRVKAITDAADNLVARLQLVVTRCEGCHGAMCSSCNFDHEMIAAYRAAKKALAGDGATA